MGSLLSADLWAPPPVELIELVEPIEAVHFLRYNKKQVVFYLNIRGRYDTKIYEILSSLHAHFDLGDRRDIFHGRTGSDLSGRGP